MTKIYFKLLFSIFLIFFLGCQVTQNNQTQKKSYQCKDYKLDMPIESVDAETNGKKSGDTHFYSHSSDEEVFYSYENFANREEAQNYFDKKTKQFMFLLRRNKLIDKNDKEIGEKILFRHESDNYCLYWTNGHRFNSVSSKSLSAIEEIEKDCNL